MKVRKKKAEKALSILLTLLMVLCMFPMTAMAETVEFSDTWDHWAKDSIERWSDYGIVNGMPEGYFNPDGGMTRAQAASVFAKLLNLKPARPANFIDVPTYEWYVDPIARVVAAGIMNGMGDGLMNPEGYVSREQFFVMFARALGIHPQETTSGVPADGSDYSTGYINALTDKGFVKGDENGVNALADISRASVVALLDQTISTYANKEGSTVKAAGSGITLVVADGVTVTGKTEMLAVAIGAEGTKGVTVENAEIGQMNVMADANVELAGDTKVDAISVDISADGSRLTVDKNATVGTIDSEASNSTIENKGTVTGTITTTGEKTDVSNSGSVASIDAKGKNTEVSNTGKVSGNITATGTVNNTGTISGNVAATGTVTNKGKVTGSIAQNGEATKPAESTSGGGGGGGSSGGSGGSSSGGSTVNSLYTVSVDTVSNGRVTANKTTNVTAGTTVTLSVAPNTGYKLADLAVKIGSTNVALSPSFDVGNPQSSYTFVKQDGAVRVTPKFEAITYNVAKEATANGSFSVTGTAKMGDTVTITASPASGYEVDTVTVTGNPTISGTGNTRTFAMPAGDVTVSVTFIALPATAPTINDQPSNVTLTVGYASGNELTVAASAAAGHSLSYQWYSCTDTSRTNPSIIAGATNATYTFATGKTDGTTEYYFCKVTATRTDNSQTTAVDSAVATVSVTAVPTYAINVNKTGEGSLTTKVGGNAVAAAVDTAIVTIEASPAAGYSLTTLTVTKTSGGEPVTVSPAVAPSTTEYTFTMPAEAVTVAVTFEQEQIATPTFSVVAGTYTSVQSVGITCATDGAEIHYTTDGSTPTGSSPTYSGPITVDVTQTINAIAVKTNWANSVVASATYTINLPPATYTASVSNSIEHGTVSVSPDTAVTQGTEITVTVTPDGGYNIGTVTYKVGEGAPVTINKTEGVYKFLMPAGNVTVTATFTAQGTVATPTFSPAAGTYVGSQSVVISCSTDGATIHYTTNGDTPTAGSPAYSTAITVNASMTIKAIAVKDGMTNSGVATAAYTITAPTYTLSVTAPTFTEVNYGYAQPAAEVITIVSSGNSNATISTVGLSGTDASSFTLNKTDGATITAGSTDNNTYTVRPNSGLAVGTYTATITVTYDGGATATADVSFTVSTAGTVATPTFTPATGAEFTESQTVTFGCETQGVTYYYTTDGTTPTTSSTQGSSVTIDATTTIKVLAVKAGMVNSAVATATYTKLEPNNISVTAANGTVVAKVGGNTVTSATSGASVTLTVTPNTGYKLTALSINSGAVEFSGSIAEAGGDYTFTMPNEAVTVDATFELIPPTTYTATAATGITGGEISVSPDTAVPEGTEITVTVTPATGYRLDSLTYTGSSSPVEINTSTKKFNMPSENVTVSATFVSDAGCATVTTVEEFTNAVNNASITMITLGADIDLAYTATSPKLGDGGPNESNNGRIDILRNMTLDIGTHTLSLGAGKLVFGNDPNAAAHTYSIIGTGTITSSSKWSTIIVQQFVNNTFSCEVDVANTYTGAHAAYASAIMYVVEDDILDAVSGTAQSWDLSGITGTLTSTNGAPLSVQVENRTTTDLSVSGIIDNDVAHITIGAAATASDTDNSIEITLPGNYNTGFKYGPYTGESLTNSEFTSSVTATESTLFGGLFFLFD